MRQMLVAALGLIAIIAHAEGQLFDVPTRDGVTISLFWEAAPNATTTLLLFPGGGGGFGKVAEGRALSTNFLVRAEPYFIAQGFNVAIFGRPGDLDELGNADRISETHMTDVRKVLAFVSTKSALPVWLVGTSRGTISATAAAINIPDGFAGLVLTSSVTSQKKPGAIAKQDLAAIKIPVLLLHHEKDACAACQPQAVPAILGGLVNAPVKKVIMVGGGENPDGDPCGPMHWHGYIGMEREAVDLIANWIKKPTN